jgi:hypothetical protein
MLTGAQRGAQPAASKRKLDLAPCGTAVGYTDNRASIRIIVATITFW